MPYSPKIFCYGRDWPLLETRRLIFQYAGFATETTQDIVTFRAKMREGDFDLLILCHSLFREDWDVVRRAAQNSPSSPILLFINAGEPKGQLQESEKSYDAWLDPAGLLNLVGELLQSRQAMASQEQSKKRHPVRQRSEKKTRNRTPRTTATLTHHGSFGECGPFRMQQAI